jgi:hypothetical protein
MGSTKILPETAKASSLWRDAYQFGEDLLDSLDLDPIYVILYLGRLDDSLLRRWLLAYWCFYHAGVASKISSAKDFYGEMRKAQLQRWPRGRERRHFRGRASAEAIEWLADYYPSPERAVDALMGSSTFPKVKTRITRWPLFGPWIAFKAADMLDRVLGVPIQFSYEDLGFYQEPAAGAALLDPEAPLEQVVRKLVKHFEQFSAPPAMDRPCGIQEVETILCKFKGWCHRTYRVGQDTSELAHALQGWGDLSTRLFHHLPQTPIRPNRGVSKWKPMRS